MTCTKEVCKECPFRRSAPAGYLGTASHDPHGFLGPHYHGDLRLPCHMRVDWEGRKKNSAAAKPETAPLCRGFVTFMKNNVKYAENEEVREAMKEVEVDRETLFGWQHEFIEHHSQLPKSKTK